MHTYCSATRDHYDRFLAPHYLWMAGGFAKNADRNRKFFQSLRIRPASTGVALDLGAGCGFSALPLADLGFRVTAVDISRPMLDELRRHDPGRRIETIIGNFLEGQLWTGRRPELVTCMGDTLTHLPEPGAVRDLIHRCHTELVPGGTLVLAFRDYAVVPEGDVAIIPVRRDADRIFLCQLACGAHDMSVTDILYSRTTGTWVRTADTYRKLRLAPGQVSEWLHEAGFQVTLEDVRDGMAVLLAVKP